MVGKDEPYGVEAKGPMCQNSGIIPLHPEVWVVGWRRVPTTERWGAVSAPVATEASGRLWVQRLTCRFRGGRYCQSYFNLVASVFTFNVGFCLFFFFNEDAWQTKKGGHNERQTELNKTKNTLKEKTSQTATALESLLQTWTRVSFIRCFPST